MKTDISWLDEKQKIALMTTVGLWQSQQLRDALKQVLDLEPDYLVWDPSEVIFPPEQQMPHENSSFERQEINHLIANALENGRLKFYFVIQKKESSAFDIMQYNARQLNVEAQVIFIDSLDNVARFIASQNI